VGRTARAAAAVVAPEATAARKITTGMPAGEVNDELQRRRRVRAAGGDPLAGTGPTGLPAHVPTAPPRPAATRPAPASPGAGPSLPQISMPAPVQTGSGFLLGLTLWGWVVLPYLRGGSSEVRKTLAAKFFNKTS